MWSIALARRGRLLFVSTLLLLGRTSAWSAGLLAEGGEYPIVGNAPGDQVYPQIALGTNGGVVVWQDNVTDGNGLGISARRINANFLPHFGVFRVNEQGMGDQEQVRAAVLKDGGAVFVWQGGASGFQHVYARFLKGDGTFAAGDTLVNTYTNSHQMDPAAAVLSNGSVIVTWSSYGQDGDMYGVYAQRFSPSGERIGSEFQVNQNTFMSQRSPVTAALPDGRFVVAWVSERVTTSTALREGILLTASVPRYTADVFWRIFDADGNPLAGEVRVSDGNQPCANPAIAISSDGGAAFVWSQKGSMVETNSWDIFARCFDSAGHPAGPAVRLNSNTYGDQFAPKIASSGADYFVVWTSLAQDGSGEGVFGRALAAGGSAIGNEIRVNTTTANRQIHAALAGDGNSRILVLWSSFIGGTTSFDLFAQRYSAVQSLPAPEPPFVSALSQSKLSVTWPELAGFGVDHYEVYVDSESLPAVTSGSMWTAANLAPGSTHSFRLAYQLADGRRSGVSAAATGTTWNEDGNLDGLPDDWQTQSWGSNMSAWPSRDADSDGDGATNLQEFLAGTDPTNPNSVLRAQIVTDSQGSRLQWNCQPGFIYQVQMSTTLAANSWTAASSARFAAGGSDSMVIDGTGNAAYYRVVRLR